jgi:hypothetical protein
LEREKQLMAKIGQLMVGQENHVKREQELLDQLNTYTNQKKTYNHLGCYTDAGGANRLLNELFSDAPDMTVDKCESACQGYKYYGLRNSKWCYCGNSFARPTETKAQADCSLPCVGNKDQKCGGPAGIDIHMRDD